MASALGMTVQHSQLQRLPDMSLGEGLAKTKEKAIDVDEASRPHGVVDRCWLLGCLSKPTAKWLWSEASLAVDRGPRRCLCPECRKQERKLRRNPCAFDTSERAATDQSCSILYGTLVVS